MRTVARALLLWLAGSAGLAAESSDSAQVAAYLSSLPAATAPVFDEARQETLATSAILCADHPEEAPVNRNSYLWRYEKEPRILESFDRNRAFFGCANWHDAVASTWMVLSTLRQNPKISLASDIRDIATTHFRKGNMDGELEFFSTEHPAPGATNFERPYGYAWLLKLYGEAKGGFSADDRKVATALAPLAKWMSERMVFYLYDLKYPYRSGVETNTAWTMSLVLDGASLAEDTTLKTAVHDNALRLFGGDTHCATSFEPQNADLISSCLSEAALMGRVMEQAAYLRWLDQFLPPVYSEAFQVYARAVDISHTDAGGADAQIQEAGEARLIALQFQRATGMLTIAYALPKDDPRIAVLRRLATLNAGWAYARFGVGGYEAQHIFSTYALLYENAEKGPAPLAPPERPKGKGGDPDSGAGEQQTGE